MVAEGLPAVGDALADTHTFEPPHGKRVFGNAMGRHNGLDRKQPVAVLRLDPIALAIGFDFEINGVTVGVAWSVFNGLFVRRQEVAI